MKLSVVIPCYNEKDTICDLIQAVRSSPYNNLEIIVVDDGSKDGTRGLLREKIESIVDKVLYHDSNQGKGAALRTGFQAATGDVVIVQDADLEYDPREYPRLMEPIIENRADVVYGSRFSNGRPNHAPFLLHRFGNRFLTRLSNLCNKLNLTDMETCYKVFKRDIIQSIDIEEDRFGFEPEITAKLARKKVRLAEVGVSYKGRSYAEGKKIGWMDCLRTLYCILKYNVLRR